MDDVDPRTSCTKEIVEVLPVNVGMPAATNLAAKGFSLGGGARGDTDVTTVDERTVDKEARGEDVIADTTEVVFVGW